MKRALFLSIILVAVLGLFISGCKKGDDTDSSGGGGDGGTELDRNNDDPPPPTCTAGELCLETEDNDVVCQDGEDNDSDGAIDRDDTDCQCSTTVTVWCSAPPPGGDAGENTAALCDNDIDDDGDGLPDCLDTDCSSFTVCGSGSCSDSFYALRHPADCPSPRDVAITEPLGNIIVFPSQLYGIEIPAADQPLFKAKWGVGPYRWDFAEVSWDEASNICQRCVGVVSSNAPSGLRFEITYDENTGEGTVKIAGAPRDTIGKYLFKIKVTDASGQSDDRVISLNLAEKVAIDVYRLVESGSERIWERMRNNLKNSGGWENEGYINTTNVGEEGFMVQANQALMLVASASTTSIDDFKWCLWRDGSNSCSGDNDLQDAHLNLTKDIPDGFEEASGVNGALWRMQMPELRRQNRVRYLSANESFSSEDDSDVKLVSVRDGRGNAARLYFSFIDFRCHEELVLEEGESDVYGNIGQDVSKVMTASGGSGGAGYIWTVGALQWNSAAVIHRGLHVPSTPTGGANSREVSFTFNAPNNLSLGQYKNLLGLNWLAKTTVTVRDGFCGGNVSRTYKYHLTDRTIDEEGTSQDENGYYLTPLVKDIKVKLEFEAEGNVIQGTTEGSKMEVRFFNEGGHRVTLASYDLHTCNVENDLITCLAEKPVTFCDDFAEQKDSIRFTDIKKIDVKFDSPNEREVEVYDSDFHLKVYLDSITITAGKTGDGSDKPYWKIYMDHDYLENHGIHGGVVGGNNKGMVHDILGSSLNDNWGLIVN